MTDLQQMYLRARAGGTRGHHAALRFIARQTGIDKDTIDRCLKRARRTDVLEARRTKAEEQAAPLRVLVVGDAS